MKKEETEVLEDVVVDTPELEEVDVAEETADDDALAKLQQENDVLADRLLRVQAELANVQRRHTNERQDLLKYRSQKLATELLPVLDNLERALQVEVSDEQGASLKKGVEMVRDSLVAALKSENVTPINALGETFNPNFHQAIQTAPAPDGQASDTVIHELQKGYQLHERVIRPAMVIVAE